MYHGLNKPRHPVYQVRFPAVLGHLVHHCAADHHRAHNHPLWRAPNLIISPHISAGSDLPREQRWVLARENLRRYIAGEKMLSVVDVERGY